MSRREIEARRKSAGEEIEEPRRGPWMPPITDPRDPNLRPARTYTDRSIELAKEQPNAVRSVNSEPGPSEFSHGRGMLAPLDLEEPTPYQVLMNERRTNPADPEATPVWDQDQNWSADGTHIALVRETEDPPELP